MPKTDLADAMRRISKPTLTQVETPQPATTVSTSNRSPSRRGRRVITAYVDPAVHRQLREIAFQHDVPIQALVEEALGDFFEKHGRPRLT